MTAEVAIMNRIGVALAADSAVTIGGGESEKAYSSADKLFHLSHSAPVGVMVYGSADYVGIPWETIIKEYRRSLGEKKFSTVAQYASDFFRFLEGSRILFPKQAQEQNFLDTMNVLYAHYDGLVDEIQEKLNAETKERGKLGETDFVRIISDIVDEELNYVRTSELLNNASVVAVLRRFSDQINKIKKACFGTLPMSAATSKKVQLIGTEILCRNVYVRGESGVVFAGFGEKEVMPVIHVYKIKGMLENKPMFLSIGESKITADSDSIIWPFAQTEILDLFIDGIHPARLEHMRDSTGEFFSQGVASILEVIGRENPGLRDETKHQVRSQIEQLVEKLFLEWDKAKEDYWENVLQMLPSFPKDELASVAEVLVELTKFRERITPGLETVGGPIDVAIITKGDGFVWIKRKLYYNPSLNPRTIA